MDSSASRSIDTLALVLLSGVEAMLPDWQPDATLLKNLDELIELLRVEKDIRADLGTLLSEALKDRHPHTCGIIRGFLLAVHAHISENFDGTPGSRYQDANLTSVAHQRLVEYVGAHMKTGVSLTDLVAESAWPPSRFADKFKRATGTTPKHWVMTQRIERVKHLLVLGELSLNEIASECGFGSQAHMSSTFSKLTGTTPRRWQSMRLSSVRAQT